MADPWIRERTCHARVRGTPGVHAHALQAYDDTRNEELEEECSMLRASLQVWHSCGQSDADSFNVGGWLYLVGYGSCTPSQNGSFADYPVATLKVFVESQIPASYVSVVPVHQ